MGQVIYVRGHDERSAPAPRKTATERLAEWRTASPLERGVIAALLAIIVGTGGVVAAQTVPAIRAAFFPITARDLPEDADPGPVTAREDAGVYDRRVPGGVTVAHTEGQPAATTDDPSEHPFVRGAGNSTGGQSFSPVQ